MTPEQTISAFLVSSFTDSQLSVLRADAVAGRVPYASCTECLVGHTGVAVGALEPQETTERVAASDAYADLSFEEDDPERCRKLIPLIDTELERRAKLRSEVVEKARSVVVRDLAEV